ncbi:cuticle collagen 7-like [Delphinapterus leucas]|uniref:Cuticle collagen 7-like n=1 Tax=Delphinapterus leucas TaxID=9749 RepID=A0A2Y9MXF1_DELLE|nr:cuticle collagen 7-like [Delphinapterus leucas]
MSLTCCWLNREALHPSGPTQTPGCSGMKGHTKEPCQLREKGQKSLYTEGQSVRELTLRPRHCPPGSSGLPPQPFPGLLATTLPPRQAPRRKRPRRECSDHRQHGSDASSCCPLPSGTRPQRMPRWSPHPGKRAGR